MVWRGFFLAILLLCGVIRPAVAAPQDPRLIVDLLNGWTFHQGDLPDQPIGSEFDDSSWQRVSLPHTWNRLGEYRQDRTSQTNNYQGASWYRLKLRTPKASVGARHLLQFDGVGTIADVWLNGQHIGNHRGGYSAFRFDVTPYLSPDGNNTLVVRADNSKPAPGSPTAAILPLSGDFFPYGGLYRKVAWIVAPPLQIDLLDHAGPGVYLTTTSASAETAQIRVRTRLRNLAANTMLATLVTTVRDGAKVKTRVSSSAQQVQASGTAEVVQKIAIPRPRLWQGRADPHLYRVTVELQSQGKLVDRVEQPLGIRTMRIDPDKGFILNDKPLPLHGVSRHQDRMGKGAALSDADHVEDMNFVEEIGANTIRFAHYQHAPKWFELADERGMVVWAEIPFVSIASFDDAPAGPEVVENARGQLIELIRQNFNHPSVAVWGIGNEVDSKVLFYRKPAKVRDLLDTLQMLAKQEDSARLTTLADCCAEAPVDAPAVSEVLVGAADTVGFNRYPGWYSADANAMGTILDRLHARFPNVPMSVSEYGAGGALSQHSDDPDGGPVNAFGRPHPEEYQARVHEENWRALRDRRYLWATWVWNLFDFASDFRGEGDAIDLNDKGLVTFDRKVRKDAFYFYKANWSREPTLHINGRRHENRPYPVATISVYSNARSVRLTVNGKNLGSQPCPERICTWPVVPLASGANTLRASTRIDGRTIHDQIRLYGPDPMAQGVRINSGDLTATVLPDGRHFGSDTFFEGGTARSLNARSITALFERKNVRKSVSGASQPILHEGYREGRFRYSVPLPNGNWQVKVSSFEPDDALPAPRSFTVVANGKTAIADFAPAIAAGGPMRDAVVRFPVQVADGHLELAFEPGSGSAVVSAIEIERIAGD